MQKLSFPAVKALYNKISLISTAAELRRLHRCLSEKPSATIQHAITSNCLSHLLPDHGQVLATSIHSPASEFKTIITGWVCTKSTALAPVRMRYGYTSHSIISTTEIATLGRVARQIARRNGILKFSGQIHQRMHHSPKASSAANAAAQQGRGNPFINPENCRLKKAELHPEYQLLLFCLAMRFSASQTSKHLHSLCMAAIWNSQKKKFPYLLCTALTQTQGQMDRKGCTKNSVCQARSSKQPRMEGSLQRCPGVGGEKAKSSKRQKGTNKIKPHQLQILRKNLPKPNKYSSGFEQTFSVTCSYQ